MFKLRNFAFMLIFALLSTGAVFAQGITTAAINGTVTDVNNEGLPGANVVATHLPSGTTYGSATRLDGSYTFPNVRVGGPYTVSVSYIGYHTSTKENIHLGLGESLTLDIVLQDDAISLDELVVSADADATINSQRTGAATSVSQEAIEAMPTISRSLGDITRLTPQSSGNSFGGRNNLYNNFSVDGSTFNNSFGLDDAVPGGQTNSQPVSLDAIEAVQVSLAPFDVRQGGFTGAGVNAVTRSGTNEYQGSVYYFHRSENLIGNKVGDAELTSPALGYLQSGFRLGGPIIKDKLFFFINGEVERRDDPGTNFVANRGTGASNESNVSAADLDEVRQIMKDVYGYETGNYEDFLHQTQNQKFLAKINWNISQSHQFSLRWNSLRAWRDVGPHPAISVTGRGPNVNTQAFENTSYVINNNLDSFVGELTSTFGTKISNRFIAGYTRFRDFRESKSAAFPSIDILKDGKNYISLGLERFSTNNVLDQDVFQITDDVSIYLTGNTVTAGLSYEQFSFANSFNLFYYAGHQFNSMDDFRAATDVNDPAYVDFNAGVTASQTRDFADNPMDVGQFSAYAQDEYKLNDNMTITAGLRMDMPVYITELVQDPNIQALDFIDENGKSVKFDVGRLPENAPLWSPRVGVNWSNAAGLQVRGGTGVFTGRIPFVWLGNQSSNDVITPFYTFQINSTVEDFKFPQVWRSNFGLDMELPMGLVASLDVIYGKDINAVLHRNYNLNVPQTNAVGADGREIYEVNSNKVHVLVPIAGLDPGAGGLSFLDAGAIILDNTDEGFQFTITPQVKKNFGSNIFTSLAYTYGTSKDVTSSPGEIAADAFGKNPVVGNPNTPTLAYSDYGQTHRIVGSASWSAEYGGRFGTSVSVFLEAGDAGRFTFVYSGDMNRDGFGGNDIMFVPATSNDIVLVDIDDDNDGAIDRTAAQQWTQLDAYIAQDDYLKDRRGDYAERNGATRPWYTEIDIRILQDVHFNVGGKRNTLQLSFDVLNLANMISSNWGVRETFNTANPLNFVGYDVDGKPNFQFPVVGDGPLTTTFINDLGLQSRWQAQFGVRYIFN